MLTQPWTITVATKFMHQQPTQNEHLMESIFPTMFAMPTVNQSEKLMQTAMDSPHAMENLPKNSPNSQLEPQGK